MVEPQHEEQSNENGSTAKLTDPGGKLREVREALGYSTERISRDLGLTESAIRDLENNNYDKFPAGIYVWGYLKNYCKLLDLPQQEILDAYAERRVMPDHERVSFIRVPFDTLNDGMSAGKVIVMIVSVAVFGAVVFLAYNFLLR